MRLAPYLLIRQAGLPGAPLLALGSPALIDYFATLRAIGAELAAAGAPLCDQLFAVAARCGDEEPAGRKRIINLRRDIHNQRRPVDLAAVWTLLDVGTAQVLTDWLARLTTRDHLLATGSGLWAAESLRVRQALQTWGRQPSFQAGLALASDSIWQKLQEYLQTPLAEQAARLRKMEPALAMYLTRASGKTSPFSSFTRLGAGRWHPGLKPLTWGESTGPIPTASAAISQAVLNRLAAAAARHPALRGAALLRCGALVRQSGDRISAYGRFDQAGNTRVAWTGERLIALDRSEAIDQVLSLIGDAALPWRKVVRRLGAGWPALLAFLVQNHVLEIGWGIPESAPDYPGALAERLDPIQSATARRLAALLRHLSALATALPLAPAAERSDLGAEVVATVGAAFALVGAEPGELNPPPIFEDCGLGARTALVGEGRWAEGLADLQRLHRLVPLFDGQRRRQGAMTAAFVARYGAGGACTDVADFLLGLPPQLQPAPDPEGAALRAAWSTLLQEATDGELDPTAIDALADQLPPHLQTEPVGYGYFVQPLPHTGGLVLSGISHGFGRAAARFVDLIDPAGTDLRPAIEGYLAGALPAGSAFLEVPGTFGFNASRRPSFGLRELHYPGTEPTVDEPVRLLDLRLEHDPASGALLLRHARTGERLVPLNLHALTPLLGPELWSRFMELQPTGPVTLPILPAFLAAGGPVQAIPQLRLGRLVLQRRTWIIRSEALPHRAKGPSDWEWAGQVEAWRQEHGLPHQVYIRATLDPAGRFAQGLGLAPTAAGSTTTEAAPATDPRPFRDQQRKPQFIDFSSPVLLRVFARHLEEVQEHLVVEEMLPEPGDWLPGPNGEVHVMEWHLELDGLTPVEGGSARVADDSHQLLG